MLIVTPLGFPLEQIRVLLLQSLVDLFSYPRPSSERLVLVLGLRVGAGLRSGRVVVEERVANLHLASLKKRHRVNSKLDFFSHDALDLSTSYYHDVLGDA